MAVSLSSLYPVGGPTGETTLFAGLSSQESGPWNQMLDFDFIAEEPLHTNAFSRERAVPV